MAPFPETEDMTVKRLYVALKRSDMQLLSMGAQKLHEKYCTGYKFNLLDDLKQILGFISTMVIPKDTMELLTNTINNILTSKNPVDNEQMQEINNQGPIQIEVPPVGLPQSMEPLETEITPIQIQPIENISSEEEQNETQPLNQDFSQENFKQDEAEAEIKEQEGPVLFTPQEYIQVQENTQYTPVETEAPKIENISFMNDNVAVFYDDKSQNTDYIKNKFYSVQLDLIGLDKEANPLEILPAVKKMADNEIGEITNILNMLKESSGEISFITTSKSEDILKTFVGNNINFDLPFVKNLDPNIKKVKVIPLFGTSNIFVCPKCGKREYFGGFHNKILTMQCKNCNSAMFPELYEMEEYSTNSNPYFWINAISQMVKSKIWILINPPLKSSCALVCEFLKTAYEASMPNKVYILSKDTARRDYYKQMFNGINDKCTIKSEFTSEEVLCDNFRNENRIN